MNKDEKDKEKNGTNHDKVIFVNKKQIKIEEDELTGKQILEKAGYDPTQYDLFLINGQSSQKIESDQTVEIKNGQHFNAILKDAPYG
ncbi:MAG: hypothetical protein GPJ54_18990 [Candidatus Heimdallarchaeota archaeon]|nr:hypothetical protein [Candidatus Heimdallarchaeota archaeon]